MNKYNYSCEEKNKDNIKYDIIKVNIASNDMKKNNKINIDINENLL